MFSLLFKLIILELVSKNFLKVPLKLIVTIHQFFTINISRNQKLSPNYYKSALPKFHHSHLYSEAVPSGTTMAKTFDGPPTLERSGSEHRRAVTSFPLMVKGKAWFRIKDPPAGEGQVGLTYHTYSHNTSDTPQK